MEANKILSADVLDIIFDGKNKEYGAYQLRKAYSKTLTKALIITGTALLLVLVGTIFANIVDKNRDKKDFNVVDTEMAEIKAEPPPPPIPPPPPAPPPPPEINQVKFTPPKIVKDEEVKPEEKIEEIKEDQVISIKTVVSENKVQIVQAPVEVTGVVEVKKVDYENQIFTKVEVEAGFPGGDAAWRNYLQKNLNGNTPIDYGAGAGKYTVMVKFVVSRDGSLSDVSCENDPGFGMCQEAVRVIKKTKNWTPAIQNGRNVNAYRRQPITFLVEEN